MTKKEKFKKGGSTAPSELLYAMVLATSASIENPDDKNARTTTDGIIVLVAAAERLPVPDGEQSLPMRDLIAAATGFIGFDGNEPLRSEGHVVSEVRDAVLLNPPAQKFINDFMAREVGWVFDFSLQPDNQIKGLVKQSGELGKVIT